MKNVEEDSFTSYCRLMNSFVQKIDEDEVETAKLYKKLIKKYNIKKIKKISISSGTKSYSLYNNRFFDYYYKEQKPIIITKLKHKIGKCIKVFDNKNIIEHVGDTKVSIHVSNSKYLNNINKNFKYTLSSLTNFIQLIEKEDEKKKKKFTVNYNKNKKKIYITLKDNDIKPVQVKTHKNGTLKKTRSTQTNEKLLPLTSDKIGKAEKERENFDDDNKDHPKIANTDDICHYYYYRSLGTNQFKDVSDIKKMNSFIKNNFFLPIEIYPPYNKFDFFSSVLRIGQTNIFIWLHYDIPDNFLIQIKGRKIVLLIPPKYITYFNILSSSSPYNLFQILKNKKLNKREQMIKKIIKKYAYVADLYEGDILFIPSLWLHYIYNMPAHTYIKKKYKSYYHYLHIVKQNKTTSSNFHVSKKEYEKKLCIKKQKNMTTNAYKKYNLNNFYISKNFINIGQKKKKKKKKNSTHIILSDLNFQQMRIFLMTNYSPFKKIKHINKQQLTSQKKKKKKKNFTTYF
uniref:JmjC domain-containing protein n=1 Tax=Piliocolobus tephrosceles TaxID=591936 RepID=A0A8C9GH12_9PRIM